MKKDMGGLARKMPITFGTWIAGTAALCGVPFFSGFFSKDEIIDYAGHNDYDGVHDRRPRRRVHDDRVHDPGDVPDVLRRAAWRCRPFRARPTHAPRRHDAPRRRRHDRTTPTTAHDARTGVHASAAAVRARPTRRG